MTDRTQRLLSKIGQAGPAPFLLSALGFIALVIVAGYFGGLRINTTPSEPLGIWRIARLDRPVELGDSLFICPPLSTEMKKARSRGYLRFGLCRGGIAPLIKTVAALPGQVVDIGQVVRIDGKVLAHSRVLSSDRERRQLTPYLGGKLRAGEVYLHSDFSGSFDSRYFGPLPISNILGLAQEVITYAP